LDYCIHYGICEPVIAVFVDPDNRNTEYWLDEDFKQFFVEEMVPWIDSQYNTVNNPARRAMMGPSLGGITSFFIVYNNPEVFGLCAGQSSAFWIEGGVMITWIEAGDVELIKFYLDCGTFESLLEGNQMMRDVLEAKGYDYVYNEWHDGHSWGNWRGHIDNILETFFPVE
jgi:enterochelin esterase family protein